MGLIKEFKEFSLKGNMIDLAVGVVVGSAFGKIVSSLVSDIVMPAINPLIPGGDWRNIVIGKGIKVGSFLGASLDFLIVAFVIFLFIKGINSMKKKQASIIPPPTRQEELLVEIRDLLSK